MDEEPPGFQRATFYFIHNDGEVYAVMEGDRAVIVVEYIHDDEILVRAINEAGARGATRGTLFTRRVADEQMAAMHRVRSEKGVTWLGGKVTRLADHPDGYPQFRVDWDVWPRVTV